MSSAQVDKILKVYRSLAQCPSISSAKLTWVGDNQLIAQSSWSERNLERSSNQKYSVDYVLSADTFKVVTSSFPIDITSELLSKTSFNGQYKAVLRSVPGKDKDPTSKQFIEVWNKQCLLKNYDLSAIDVHGDVYCDGEFGSFEWSSEADKLIYIAEKKLKKSEPFYKQKSLDSKKNDDKSDNDEITKGNEYIYKGDWGEQLVGKHIPAICMLDTNLNTIVNLPGIPDDLSPGQIIWTPANDAIVGVALKHEPRRLGLVFCTNRESWIFLLKDGKMEKLSSDNCSVRSPRFSPDGKHLVWIERDLSGPHHNAQRIMHINWEASVKKPNILVDVVSKSITIENNKPFYGVYNRTFPRRCWSSDSRYLFFSNPQRSNVRSYVLEIETKKLTEIESDTSSLSILDVKNNILLFSRTSLVDYPRLFVGRFDNKNLNRISLGEISSEIKAVDLDNITYEFNEYQYNNDERVRDFNYIYFGPKTGADKSCPLIVVPHGGPHSAFANMFSLEASLLTLLGFGILQVNYRGSTGMGSDNVEYLQGRVGTTDVIDCVTATKQALNKYPWLDPQRVGLSGGSHGGFLVAHLSGQYNDMYKAVVARNPVIDVAAMFTISDIPDCRNALFKDERMALGHDVCAAAVNQQYRQSFTGEPKSYAEELTMKMFKCSPIVHADNVKAPTLVCIGKNDLRVPPSQGKYWYNRLKANGVKTKMLVYDDNHPLSSGPVEIDEIINAALWLLDHVDASN
ncbi:acylamino-acid-releasing enzyme-like isoform X1 [Microplitis mediator]|uniref:acylamino-acid-releasing enzyme-like isoform X1 n=1 Tax=Microplitis mediator TaxID=375433 RepID=UPI00255510C0|nr:acylamino-acid-releasing enzyme-like isoform X1 [Microplitis mediator]XP_057327095.1 acylamino-acid-releasing enzyme-like isoform X1 [Microplitis mediator]